MTHILLLLGLLAIFLYIFLDIARQANARLREDVEAHYEAAQQYEAHVVALEAYTVYLEACRRHSMACEATTMLTMQAVDTGERLFVMDGEMP